MEKPKLLNFENRDYEQCSIKNIPPFESIVYYPMFPLLPQLKECDFLEVIGDDFLVRMVGVGKFRDKAEKFYIKQ